MDFSKLKALYSTDEEMLELEDQDVTTNITGYVDAIIAPASSGKKNELLFKFILTNGSKKIVVLVWSDTLVNKYCKDVCSSRIININGGHCRTVSLTKFKKENNYVPFEIIVRDNTEISYLGYHLMMREETNNKVQTATFENIQTMQGLIEISGYLRTKFALTQTRSGLCYGLGAITDGIRKVTVQVKKFEQFKFELGDYVTITGSVTGQDSIIVIFCESINDIKYDPEVPSLSLEQVLHGGRAVKRVLTKE